VRRRPTPLLGKIAGNFEEKNSFGLIYTKYGFSAHSKINAAHSLINAAHGEINAAHRVEI
jgi:hypothetical protein